MPQLTTDGILKNQQYSIMSLSHNMFEENMSTETQHSEIMKALGRLEGLYTGIVNQMTYANGRVGKLEAEFKVLEKVVGLNTNAIDNLKNHESNEEKSSERRKDWMWGAGEKMLFAILGALFILGSIVLQNLHILNLKIN